MPRVSVVMAVYNGERYVREAIDSILAQTFADFEFLIIDDGSTDRTLEILRSYDDPRIHLLVNAANSGLAASLNRGLSRARGEFVARQDADDISEPSRLEKQVAYLDAHPEVALLGTWATYIDGAGRVIDQVRYPCTAVDLRWALFFYCPFVHSAVMLRRERVLDTVGAYDEALAYSMDFEYWRRIADRHAVANLGAYLVRYRMHDSSMTATYGERSAEGRRLRAARSARFLGWRELEVERNEARHAAMTALLDGRAAGVALQQVAGAVDDLLRLHGEFSEAERLPDREAERRRAALRVLIGRHLVLLARTCAGADLQQRRKVLARAFRLAPAIYLHPRTLIGAGLALLRGLLPLLGSSPAPTA